MELMKVDPVKDIAKFNGRSTSVDLNGDGDTQMQVSLQIIRLLQKGLLFVTE